MNEQNHNPQDSETQADVHGPGPGPGEGNGSSGPGAHDGQGRGGEGPAQGAGNGGGDGPGDGDGHGHDPDSGHGHGPGHDDPLHPNVGAPLDEDELDPANRSLADALRLSFAVLKVVMIGLLIFLAFSGTRTVNEGEVAVKLLFGAVAGDPGERVKEPGVHWNWPEPIGQFIRVRTNQRTVSVTDAFWYAKRNGNPVSRRTLVPGRDGFLLTGDKNVVHGKWDVNYRVAKPNAPRFIRNIGTSGGTEAMWDRADRLVRNISERAIVHAVASVSTDDYVNYNINRLRIQREIQQRLRELNAGITVEQVLFNQAAPPVAVQNAFQLVSDAEAERDTKIEEAKQYASRVLNEVAGSDHRALIRAIDAYERARRRGDQKAIEKADARITKLLDVDSAQGQVSEVLREAQLYKRSIVSTVRAEADKYRSLLPEYRNNPRIVLDRLWQDARQEILGGEVETFYLPSREDKELWLEINRDPRIQDRRERQRFLEKQQGGGSDDSSSSSSSPPSRYPARSGSRPRPGG